MSINLLIKSVADLSKQIAKTSTDITATLTPALEGGRILLGNIRREIATTTTAAGDAHHVIIDVLKDSETKTGETSAIVSTKLQGMKITAKKHVDDTTQIVQQGQADTTQAAGVTVNTLQGVAAAAQDTANTVVGAMAAAQNAAQTTFDLYKHGPGQAALEDYVAHQKDLITQIENTMFGGYLDEYANAYEQLQKGGSQLSPQMIADLNKTLQGTSDIIRRFAGAAGSSFSFDQFKRDLDELMAAQKKAASPTSGGKTGGGTQSTGAAGSPAPGACDGGSAPGGKLRLGNWSGGLP